MKTWKLASRISSVILMSLILTSGIHASVHNELPYSDGIEIEKITPSEQPEIGFVTIYYFSNREARIIYQVEYKSASDIEAVTVMRDYSTYITKKKGFYHYKNIKPDEKKMHGEYVQYIRNILIW